jgi:hypothetical protein
MYPVALPYARLRAWVDASPDLCICFRDSAAAAAAAAAVAGVIVVLPLRRRHWEDLLVGRLKESDVEAGSMFPGSVTRGCGAGGDGDGEGEEVGLHVYHVERFDVASDASGFGKGRGVKGFSEYALAEVMKRVEMMMPGWKVLGLSGTFTAPAQCVRC